MVNTTNTFKDPFSDLDYIALCVPVNCNTEYIKIIIDIEKLARKKKIRQINKRIEMGLY